MKKLFAWLVAAVTVMSVATVASANDVKDVNVYDVKDVNEVRFRPLHIHIDAGDTPMAAFQLELTVKSGDAKIVGVEGAEHPAFARPPYYDPAALMSGRIILAAFSTAKELPVADRMLPIAQGPRNEPMPKQTLTRPSAATRLAAK